jgi:hypothetical protein
MLLEVLPEKNRWKKTWDDFFVPSFWYVWWWYDEELSNLGFMTVTYIFDFTILWIQCFKKKLTKDLNGLIRKFYQDLFWRVEKKERLFSYSWHSVCEWFNTLLTLVEFFLLVVNFLSVFKDLIGLIIFLCGAGKFKKLSRWKMLGY